jgi:hypothetical protein
LPNETRCDEEIAGRRLQTPVAAADHEAAVKVKVENPSDKSDMGEQFQFENRGDLKAIVGEHKIIASSIGPSGDATLLTVDAKYEKEPSGREERKGFAIFPFSKAKQHYPATFIRFDGRKTLQKTELAEVEITFPSVQPLPNGEILLVGARCYYRDGDPDKNASVFSQDGKLQRRFVLGDGINSGQTTSEGLIWTSYFDEGVFGNCGWNQPMGASGLNCFDSTGRVVWEFKPPDGFDSICDCYATNVADDAVWVCYYTEFPLVRIDSDYQVQGWKNDVGGASALAVDGRRALLLGGYGEKRTRCVVQDISQESLINSREIEIGLPSGFELIGATVIGRGSTLHAFTGNSWFTFDLRQVA